MNDERIVQLLSELREGQREQLAHSRNVAERSLDAQRMAIDMQRRSARLYRIVVSVMAPVVAALVALLFFRLTS